MRRLSACVLVSCVLASQASLQAQSVSKIPLWRRPSYFRGFVISPNVPISQQDILDIKQAGATIAYLATDGFRSPVAPYGEDSVNIQALDKRVGDCDAAGMHYAIAVRQGPGRYDVALEGSGADPPSTIWKNTLEQQLYGSMLREITARYAADTLFAGITPTVEPDPFFDSLCCIDSAQYSFYCQRNNVNLQAITQLWVDSIRAASADVPILIQGPGYTSPILFSLVPLIADPNIVYEFHNYHPIQFTEAKDTAQVSYPGTYLDAVNGTIGMVHYDRSFLEDSLLAAVSQIAQETHAPIFMGEFGMTYPHPGGPEYLADMSSIALEKGWHFAYFDYWHRPPGQLQAWDYKNWDPAYWSTILTSFQQGSGGVQWAIAIPSSLTISGSDRDGSWRVEWAGEHPTADVQARIYDMLGRVVESLHSPTSDFILHTGDLTHGMYLLLVSSGSEQASKLFSIVP